MKRSTKASKPKILPPAPDSTSVTVTQVETPLDCSPLSSVELDKIVQKSLKRVSNAIRIVTREMRLRLLSALLELEKRFDKKQGIRNDLRELKVEGWHDYLKSRHVDPARYRQWKSRNKAALKGVEDLSKRAVGEPAEKPKKVKLELPDLEETEAEIMAKAGVRLAQTLINPSILPEQERYAKALKYAEEMAEAVQGGRYQQLIRHEPAPAKKPEGDTHATPTRLYVVGESEEGERYNEVLLLAKSDAEALSIAQQYSNCWTSTVEVNRVLTALS